MYLKLLSLALLSMNVLAQESIPKHTMKSNSQVVYNEEAGEVEQLSDMFGNGKFYGRLRTNNFYFWWDQQDTINKDIHFISGIGGSLVYKSATYSHFDVGGALYYSYASFKFKDDLLNGWKAGKDATSRYNIAKTGSRNMAVLGEAYLRYRPTSTTELIAGRQIVESFYTKSNDTKMIPNTFDGLVFAMNDVADTSLKVAYLARQKLRDHTQSHAVFMRGDCESDGCSDPSDINQSIVASWSENDDGAMHRGLTYTNLKNANKPTDAPLITGDFSNESISNLRVDLSFYSVPELLSQVMGELNYAINLGKVSVTPAFRYIKQFDNGAGAVGGASISGKESISETYNKPNSLESQMIAARIVTRFSDYKINLAYTYILDEADLVTPWRGFPTSGYTRSMARYNWRANTKSTRLEVVRSLSDIGLYNDLFVQTSILYQDNDDKAYGGINTDSIYYYLGLMQNVAYLDNMQWRFRIGFQDFTDTKEINNLDTRFEINYLF